MVVKKRLGSLVLVFILSVITSAFAATPNDVSADHWAYKAVKELARVGVIDGYGDGSFRGDKLMTRYEMAQVVEKAMANSAKATAVQKALIDKLATEFALELNKIDTRVTNLEKNQPTVKFSGFLQTRYNDTDYTNGSTKKSDVMETYRFRLDTIAKVDTDTAVGFRFVSREPDKANFGNNSWTNWGTNAQGNNLYTSGPAPTIDRVFFTTKIGDAPATIGRQAFKIDDYEILMDSGVFSFDGITTGWKWENIDTKLTYGRFISGANYLDSSNAAISQFNILKNLDVAGISLSSKSSNLSWGLGYYDLRNFDMGKSAFTWSVFNLRYLVDPRLSLGFEYVRNSAAKFGDTANGANSSNIWATKLVYGDQALVKKGDQNFGILYMRAGGNAFSNRFSALALKTGNNFDNMVDCKALYYQYNYTFSKAFTLTAEYQTITTDKHVDSGDARQWRLTTNMTF